MPISPLRRISFPVLAAAAIAALYAAASWSNQFVYDDHEVIENQYPIRASERSRPNLPRTALPQFSLLSPADAIHLRDADVRMGTQSAAYHLFNALLAAAVMLAAYALLRRPQFGLGEFAAMIAATWFAIHPAISECVYPAASGRETLLPALFIILTIWAYLGRGTVWFCLAMLLFLAALLCKEQAAVLPGLFLLADLLGLSDPPNLFDRLDSPLSADRGEFSSSILSSGIWSSTNRHCI